MTGANDDRLGLTDDEVTILRARRHHDTDCSNLVSLYEMVRTATPHDNGARAIFATALSEWRFARRREAEGK